MPVDFGREQVSLVVAVFEQAWKELLQVWAVPVDFGQEQVWPAVVMFEQVLEWSQVLSESALAEVHLFYSDQAVDSAASFHRYFRYQYFDFLHQKLRYITLCPNRKGLLPLIEYHCYPGLS